MTNAVLVWVWLLFNSVEKNDLKKQIHHAGIVLVFISKTVKANDVQYIICNCTQTKQIDTEPICATWGINY